ncbi:MAG: ATP-grasp domain-containing protein [Nitrospinota bacterium]
MAQSSVMVLGGSVYTVPSVQTLKEHGYRVVVVDGNSKADCFGFSDVCGRFDFRNVEKGIELAKKENIKAVVPTHDRAVIPAAKISESLGLNGPSVEAAKIATNKTKMRAAWQKAGLPSPQFTTAGSFEEFKDALKRIGLPAICKPTDDVGGGSRGIQKIDDTTDLRDAYKFATSFSESNEVLVETFCEGLEHSVEVLMRDGKGTLLMASDKVKTAPPYRVDLSVVYPTRLKNYFHRSMCELAVGAAQAVGLTDGAAHVELCTLPDNRQILFEIGLRCGGGVTPHPVAELVTGVNQMVEYVEILIGNKNRDIEPKYINGASFQFITSKPGRIKQIDGFDEAASAPGIQSACLTVKPGDTIDAVKTSSQRLGYFVATGKSAEEAYKLGVEAQGRLRFIYD